MVFKLKFIFALVVLIFCLDLFSQVDAKLNSLKRQKRQSYAVGLGPGGFGHHGHFGPRDSGFNSFDGDFGYFGPPGGGFGQSDGGLGDFGQNGGQGCAHKQTGCTNGSCWTKCMSSASASSSTYTGCQSDADCH